jgi:hypothetical protein
MEDVEIPLAGKTVAVICEPRALSGRERLPGAIVQPPLRLAATITAETAKPDQPAPLGNVMYDSSAIRVHQVDRVLEAEGVKIPTREGLGA